MKRIVRVLILVCFVLCLLPACSPKNDNHYMVVCGSYGVPGMFCYDLKGGTYSCEVLEIDCEGRTLFEYTGYNQVAERDVTAFVICQQYNSQLVFFYEDCCYIFTSNPEELQILKDRNDWGEPMDYSKMTQRPVEISFDGFIVTGSKLNYSMIIESCCSKLGILKTDIQDLCFLDIDPSGNEMYWLTAQSDGVVDCYFVIVSPQYVVSLLESDVGVDYAESMAAFKDAAGWDYSHNLR